MKRFIFKAAFLLAFNSCKPGMQNNEMQKDSLQLTKEFYFKSEILSQFYDFIRERNIDSNCVLVIKINCISPDDFVYNVEASPSMPILSEDGYPFLATTIFGHKVYLYLGSEKLFVHEVAANSSEISNNCTCDAMRVIVQSQDTFWHVDDVGTFQFDHKLPSKEELLKRSQKRVGY